MKPWFLSVLKSKITDKTPAPALTDPGRGPLGEGVNVDNDTQDEGYVFQLDSTPDGEWVDLARGCVEMERDPQPSEIGAALCRDGAHEADGGCCWERDRELLAQFRAETATALEVARGNKRHVQYLFEELETVTALNNARGRALRRVVALCSTMPTNLRPQDVLVAAVLDEEYSRA